VLPRISTLVTSVISFPINIFVGVVTTVVVVDASAFATGAILTQTDSRGKPCAIGFHSKTFSDTERNYDIHDRELLAVIHGLEAWRHLLADSAHPVTVLTDHKNLEYYSTPQRINRRVACYIPRLADYNYKLSHFPGTANKADLLSRRPDLHSGNDDNTGVLVLPPSLFANAATLSSLDECVRAHQFKHATTLSQWSTTHNLTKIGDLYWRNDLLVVVEDNNLRKGVISLYHDSTTTSHPGITKTLWSISHDFWWPNMKDTITNYIKGCALCQSRKNNPTNPKPPLFPIPSDTYTLPFESIALDFITKLPHSQTYDTILTITDTFSKASIFIPCNETIDLEKTALLYATYVLPHYGLPSHIISDRDPRFTSTFTKELCRLLQIDQNISTAYHPQTDGQSECTNQWLEQYLRIFTNFQQNDWVSWLPLAQYAHNSWPNATTKKAPFELIMGHIPRVHQTTRTSVSPSVETRLQNVTEVRQQVTEAIRRSQELITHIPTRFTPYCVGDKVWLDAKNLNTSHPSAKLGPKRYGPFLVTAAVSRTSFRLKLPPQWKIHNVFHASLLTPYNETTTHGPNFQEPLPDLIDGQPEWEVEQILGARWRRNQLQYLVRWKGFSEAHDSWEPLSHINAEQLIEDFCRQNPDAVNTVELITNTPASTHPITIRCITMSSPKYTSADSTPASPAPTSPPPLIARLNLPLAARIDNEDEPSSPVSTTVLSTHPHSPASTEPCDYEVNLAMHGFSVAIPCDFVRFDHSIPNHYRYGKKIHMPDRTVRWPQYICFVFDHDTQQHFVAATRDNLDNGCDQYGWTLEAAPFIGPAIADVDDSELDILADSGPDKLKVDIALHAVNNKGISADVSRLRHLATQRRALQE
jgi:hypothetical protein